jgi:tetratricopeptide (TPR) repeat protein
MIFGGAPAAQKPAAPVSSSPGTAPEPPAPVPARAEEPAPPAEEEEPAAEAAVGEDAGEAGREPGPFDKAPPRGLLIGVAAGLGLLLVIGGGLVAYRKLARHVPPPAAVEMITSAQADAAQDTLASIASAETKAHDSLDAAGPRARFPEAIATLARIRVQWADALGDEAARIADGSPDDPKAAQLQGEAKAKLKSAFEVLLPAMKADKDSPELQLALADYYRAQRSPSNMNRYLKAFKDDPRAALIQGMALQQEDEGGERAIARLKAALAADPRGARAHFRLALAYAAARDEAGARAELEETLRLSPQHERARALRERMGKPGAAEKKQ